MLLTYDIIFKAPSQRIEREYELESHTRCEWFQFCREVILDYVETTSEKIGDQGKVVEIDESKFGKRKYNRGHYVRVQWVFGCTERGSGRTSPVSVPERIAETLSGHN
jgi:hypothetical protein